jgi:ArsR family transcriptional regulator
MKDTQIVKIAKALADPTRHQMLQEIRARGELNCSQIHELFALSQPTISHHIKMLAVAGLVNCRKQGQYHVMTVDEDVLSGFAQSVAGPVSAGAAKPASRKPAGAGRSGLRKARAKS